MFRENILGGQALLQDCRRWLLVRIQVDTNFFPGKFLRLLPFAPWCVCSTYKLLHKCKVWISPALSNSLPKEHADLLFRLITFVCVYSFGIGLKNIVQFLELILRHIYSVAPHSKYIFGAHRCKKTGINIPKQHLIFRSYFSHEKQKKV